MKTKEIEKQFVKWFLPSKRKLTLSELRQKQQEALEQHAEIFLEILTLANKFKQVTRIFEYYTREIEKRSRKDIHDS